jgi:hypothetical protein
MSGSKQVSSACTPPRLPNISTPVQSETESYELSVVERVHSYGEEIKYYTFDIMRPSKEPAHIEIIYNPDNNTTYVFYDKEFAHIVEKFDLNADIKPSVYNHPTLNTKANPHHAAAIISGTRMISFIWFGGQLFFVYSWPRTLEELYDTFVNDTTIDCYHQVKLVPVSEV